MPSCVDTPQECRETFRGAQPINELDHLSPGQLPWPAAAAGDLDFPLPTAERVTSLFEELLYRIAIRCLPSIEPTHAVSGDEFLYELLLIADDVESCLVVWLRFTLPMPACFAPEHCGSPYRGIPANAAVSFFGVFVAGSRRYQTDAEPVCSAEDGIAASVEPRSDFAAGAPLCSHLGKDSVFLCRPRYPRRPGFITMLASPVRRPAIPPAGRLALDQGGRSLTTGRNMAAVMHQSV